MHRFSPTARHVDGNSVGELSADVVQRFRRCGVIQGLIPEKLERASWEKMGSGQSSWREARVRG